MKEEHKTQKSEQNEKTENSSRKAAESGQKTTAGSRKTADGGQEAETIRRETAGEKQHRKKPEAAKKSRKKKKKKKKSGISFSTIFLVIILLAGGSIMLYPVVSDWWNSRHASQAIANYVDTVSSMDQDLKEEMLEAARRYNASLSPGIHLKLTEEEYAEYESLLDLTGTGIMGYIEIPSINVNLPVYHGTDESTLQIAVGHIAGSSLPVGGEGSHCVMSGHRGLPTARLFTDLDDLGEGDIFLMNVLDETFTYEVDQIRIVSPDEVDDLAIVAGKDYCTLVTCTPYGINTHRMLVRGRRIDNIDDSVIIITAEASRIPTYYVIPAIGVPMLFVALVVMLIRSGRKGRRKSQRELLEALKRQDEDE